MFSLNRVYASAVLPSGKDYTFWGKGVSQGHSDAVRQIEGVIDARQYTIPVDEALDKVRSGLNPDFTTREKHTRLVYVVAKEDAVAMADRIIRLANDDDLRRDFTQQGQLDIEKYCVDNVVHQIRNILL
mgnify:CR=1 FL=1